MWSAPQLLKVLDLQPVTENNKSYYPALEFPLIGIEDSKHCRIHIPLTLEGQESI